MLDRYNVLCVFEVYGLCPFRVCMILRHLATSQLSAFDWYFHHYNVGLYRPSCLGRAPFSAVLTVAKIGDIHAMPVSTRSEISHHRVARVIMLRSARADERSSSQFAWGSVMNETFLCQFAREYAVHHAPCLVCALYLDDLTTSSLCKHETLLLPIPPTIISVQCSPTFFLV